jgi:hypothetical protein
LYTGDIVIVIGFEPCLSPVDLLGGREEVVGAISMNRNIGTSYGETVDPWSLLAGRRPMTAKGL